jgi:hypothetical protein
MVAKPACQQVFKWYCKKVNWHCGLAPEIGRKSLICMEMIKTANGIHAVLVLHQSGIGFGFWGRRRKTGAGATGI